MGTIFNTEAMDGTWFPYQDSVLDPDGEPVFDDPKPGAAKFLVRSIDKYVEGQMARRKRVKEYQLNPKTRAMEVVAHIADPTPEEREETERGLIDYAIVDWADVLDAQGKQVECNLDNKMRLARIPAVDRFLARCFRLIGESAVTHEDALTENL
jgi:hypothetical protein